MPAGLKWSLIGAITALCIGASYLMVTRGPALLLDIGGGLAGCF
jgi:hypothetical protein